MSEISPRFLLVLAVAIFSGPKNKITLEICQDKKCVKTTLVAEKNGTWKVFNNEKLFSMTVKPDKQRKCFYEFLSDSGNHVTLDLTQQVPGIEKLNPSKLQKETFKTKDGARLEMERREGKLRLKFSDRPAEEIIIF